MREIHSDTTDEKQYAKVYHQNEYGEGSGDPLLTIEAPVETHTRRIFKWNNKTHSYNIQSYRPGSSALEQNEVQEVLNLLSPLASKVFTKKQFNFARVIVIIFFLMVSSVFVGFAGFDVKISDIAMTTSLVLFGFLILFTILSMISRSSKNKDRTSLQEKISKALTHLNYTHFGKKGVHFSCGAQGLWIELLITDPYFFQNTNLGLTKNENNDDLRRESIQNSIQDMLEQSIIPRKNRIHSLEVPSYNFDERRD